MDRDHLGGFEYVVILGLIRLREDAYGVTVRQEIETRTGREVSIGAVYATLDRLETKGTSDLASAGDPRAWRPFETLLSCHNQGNDGCEPHP